MAYQLKPFVINLNDLSYLLQQVNFKPMFDAQGNAVVNWDGVSAVFDTHNQPFNLTGLSQQQAWDAYGHGFPSVAAPIGIRDVTGFHNNLFGTQAQWGAVEAPFVRSVPADYSNYITSPGANYTPGSGTGSGFNVTDLMPRIISRTITTAGVNLLADVNGHYVEWRAAKYGTDGTDGTDPAYGALINASGVDVTQLVEGAKIVAPVDTQVVLLDGNGDPLVYIAANYQASIVYTVALAVFGAQSYGGLVDATGGALTAGEAIFYRPAANSPLVSIGQTFQPDVLAYKQLIDAAGVNFATIVDNTVITTTVTASGYGLLETLGHIDYQNPTSGEFFIGSENPGVAPVNSWFAIFGQFFDHGLDKLGAGGNGKITIALEQSDPLYGAPGPNGPVTSITVTRATIAGADVNGDPTYINHTSPFIDQSQTYGSHEQLTNLLRKWVDTDGNGIYQAGMELLDGTTLVDAWTRKMPVYDQNTGLTTIVETPVHDTLPTLAELRAHLLATGRDDLSWSDVLDLRNRDANGDVDLGAGAGNSGSPLLLDMNPHFDAGHISAAALNELNTQSGASFTATTLSYGALIGMGLIDPSTNQVNANFPAYLGGGAISVALQNAVSEVLLQSVGDHYIAGDGRVNENFGLTSIHHVFHEEHNYQVQNLQTWIYAHDANNSPLDHAGLHEWQVNTLTTGGSMDAHGNYLYANGQIAWDADKMFEATKLIVEMEYQHAAVDQYARTITPRIQEFVGYSSGVDSTITLEYAQVAFRFGHSTIRETIDTIDPSGWFKGAVTHFALESAFLAPQTFAQEGIAAITLGLSRQQMNEVDEFITPALNQGLLGQPLDLAAINIARGRDMGIPTLNDFREAISLARYTSWSDFGAGMFHPESLVTFMAAYSFGGGDAGVALAQEILDLADGVITVGANFTAAEALAFMNNNASGNATLDAARSGFDHIDSWIGGLAEAHVPGGLLGETFDAVFVAQIQALMDGDRFYYLYRLFGTQIAEEVNNGQFKDLVERNTGLEHLNGSIFAYADKYYDFNRAADGTLTGAGDNLADHLYHDTLAANPTLGMYSDGGATTANNGSIITINGVDYIRDVRPELDPTQTHPLEGTPVSGADSHEVIVGTNRNDFIHARGGDDTVYGDEGDDIIYGDGGIDRLYGGDGNDYLDSGEGPDLVDGGAGKDTIYGRGSGSEVGGFDQLVGGSGNDLVIGGEGIDKLSSGSGDDIVFGDGLTNPEMGNTDPFTHAGDGNDYVDGGASGDLIYGEEGDDYIVGGTDQDLMQGGQGDDIIRPGKPSQAIGGGPDEVIGDDGYTNMGFDLVDFSDYAAGGPGVTISLINQTNPLINIDGTTPIPAMAQIEGIIGSSNNDTLGGEMAAIAVIPGAAVNVENNWLIGGSGNDTISGSAGNDLIIGGSVRLDTLIGKYADAANASGPGNLALGSQAWIDDAMRTGSVGYTPGTILNPINDGYDNDVQNAYTGSSNQATGALSGGLLAGVNTTIAGTANDFELHFTDMLKSRMFKDMVLGDGGADGTSDIVVFTGNRSDYSIVTLDINGAVTNVPANIFAYKVIDNRAPGAVDANGDPIVTDGTDIVVGVERFQFADRTLVVGNAPSLDLTGPVNHNYLDQFTTSAQNGSYGSLPWASSWVETGDNASVNSATAGQIRIDNNNSNSLQFRDDDTDVGNGTATIQRTVNLAGVTSATLSYSYNENSFDAGEIVTVTFSDDGSFSAGHIQTVQTINSTSNNGNTSVALAGVFTADAAIRFVVSGTNNNSANDIVSIDNVNIAYTTAGPAGNDYAINYTENASGMAIADFPSITDDDSIDIFSAKVRLTNAQLGDTLSVGGLPPGIVSNLDLSIAGEITLNLTGFASLAAYQTAIQAARFSSTADVAVARMIEVTVSDGLQESNVATTTVNFTLADDPMVANNDTIITNSANGAAFVLPEWVFLKNDVDADSVMDVTAVSGATSLTASLATNPGSITITDAGGLTPNGGSFIYTGTGSDTATVNVVYDANNVAGDNGNNILAGNDGSNTFDGGTGDDIIFAGAGDDTIVWNSNNFGGTDGRDFVDGGANGAVGDRFTVTGNSSVETFNIYTAAAATSAGFTGLNVATEIVVTRNGVIVAELDNIEEITINTLNTTANNGNNAIAPDGGTNGGDTINVYGDFTSTSLNYNTITVNGGAGNDTVDITGLTSDHHVVFTSNGGTDTVIGVRTQDVVYMNDNIKGTSGNDVINAGEGDDVITGGMGADTLTGGTGADTFVFNSASESGVGAVARDLITDFVSGVDKLNFSGIDARIGFGAGLSGNQAFTFNDVAGAAFTGAAQLVYHYEGTGADAITVIQGNVNNNLGADFEVALTGHVTFNQTADLVL
jgi:Ca2+-binding RTX toxin-like protein